MEEAKERMSYAEFLNWLVYKQMRGSLNTGNRLESLGGLLASTILKAIGGKAEAADFMPHAEKHVTATLNDVIKEFGGVKRG